MITHTEYKFGNAYIQDDTVIFHVGSKTYGELWAKVDLEDWENVRQMNWGAMRRRKVFYVRATKDGKQILLHRFLLNPENGLHVDHINGDPLDNTRNNLRSLTLSENNRFGVARRMETTPITTTPHRVKRRLVDGTYRVHEYPPRTKRTPQL